MGSRYIDGIRFQVYPKDHYPVHAHAFIGSGQVVVELFSGHFRIRNVLGASKSDVRKVLTAANNAKWELIELWERSN